MKLKHILPVTMLAVLALAACDPVASDTSSGAPSSSEEEVVTLGSYIDDLAVGVQDEGVLADLLELLPAADESFTTQSNDYTDYSSPDNYEMQNAVVAKRYENDVLEVSLDSQISERVDGVWGEFGPYYSSVETMWADASNLNYVYEEDGDPTNAYSFALSLDLNAEVLGSYLDSVGALDDIELGLATVDYAYTYYLANGSWNYVTKSGSIEKVAAAGEVPEYLVLKAVTNFGYLYSGQLAWGAGYEGVFVERFYSYGIEVYIVDGAVDSVFFDQGTMYQRLYTDSAATSETPAPVIAGTSLPEPSPVMTNEEWATYVTNVSTVTVGELGYGLYITFTEMAWSTASNGAYALAELPDVSAFRAGDATDAGYWVDVEGLLA